MVRDIYEVTDYRSVKGIILYDYNMMGHIEGFGATRTVLEIGDVNRVVETISAVVDSNFGGSGKAGC